MLRYIVDTNYKLTNNETLSARERWNHLSDLFLLLGLCRLDKLINMKVRLSQLCTINYKYVWKG